MVLNKINELWLTFFHAFHRPSPGIPWQMDCGRSSAAWSARTMNISPCTIACNCIFWRYRYRFFAQSFGANTSSNPNNAADKMCEARTGSEKSFYSKVETQCSEHEQWFYYSMCHSVYHSHSSAMLSNNQVV